MPGSMIALNSDVDRPISTISAHTQDPFSGQDPFSLQDPFALQNQFREQDPFRGQDPFTGPESIASGSFFKEEEERPMSAMPRIPQPTGNESSNRLSMLSSDTFQTAMTSPSVLPTPPSATSASLNKFPFSFENLTSTSEEKSSLAQIGTGPFESRSQSRNLNNSMEMRPESRNLSVGSGDSKNKSTETRELKSEIEARKVS